MRFYFFLVFANLLSIVVGQFDEFINFSNDKYINGQVNVEQFKKEYESDYGEPYGVAQCGGEGTLKNVYIETCDDNDDPCVVKGDGDTIVMELVYLQSENANQLGSKLEEQRGRSGSFVTIWDKPIKDSRVKGDKITVVTVDCPKVSRIWAGQYLWSRFTVYRMTDNEIEMCVTIKFKVK